MFWGNYMDTASETDKEFNLLTILKVLRRRWLSVVLPAILFMLIAGVYTMSTSKWYASGHLRLASITGITSFETNKFVAEYVGSSKTLYANKLGLSEKAAGEFIKNLSVTYEKDAALIHIYTLSSDKQAAKNNIKFVLDDIVARHTVLYNEANTYINAELEQINARMIELQGIIALLYGPKPAGKSSWSDIAIAQLEAYRGMSIFTELNALREKRSLLQASLLKMNNNNTEQVGEIDTRRSISETSVIIFAGLLGLCLSIFFLLRGHYRALKKSQN